MDSTITVNAVVATRALQTDSDKNFRDVRIGRSDTLQISVQSIGSAGTTIINISLSGINPSEYKIILPIGVNPPIYLAPGAPFNFSVEFKPKDIEKRQAQIVFEMEPK